MMLAELLVNSLGHSIRSKPLAPTMRELGLSTKPSIKESLDVSGNAYLVSLTNKAKGIALTFEGYARYRTEFGEPLSRIGTSKNELMLMTVTFDRSRVALPFGLRLGDTKDTVTTKLGRKPRERTSKLDYGHAWLFHFGEYRLLTAFDHRFKLLFIRFIRLDLSERKRARLQAHLRAQNKSIEPDNVKAIAAFSKRLPTAKWTRRMKSGDSSFTKAGIDEARALLERYVSTLVALTNRKAASGIYNSVKKLVLALNKLNARHDSMIETLEREELCDFIDKIIRATGLEVAAGTDLTEPWREW